MNQDHLVSSFREWHLRSQGNIARRLAIQLVLPSTPNEKSLQPCAIVASDGKAIHWIVNADQFAAFFDQHSGTQLLFDDIGRDFWYLDQLLYQREKPAALAWRKRLQAGRLTSIPILHQLLHLATAKGDGVETLPRKTLTEIAEEAGIVPGAISIDGNEPRGGLSRQCVVRSAKWAVLSSLIYRQLRRRAKKLSEWGLDKAVLSDAVQRYGLLTEHLQAAAEVALARLSRRGVRVHQGRLHKLEIQLQEDQRRSADQLANLVPGLLVKTDDRFELTGTGRFRRRDAVLDNLLDRACRFMRRKDPTIVLPTTATGNISRSPQDWQPFARDCPAVQHWINLERVQNSIQYLRGLDHVRLHPEYTTLLRTGRTSCSNPPLQGLPRSGGIRELIVPRKGYAFLIVDCQCFELVALAAICQQRYGHSHLADVLAAKHDPHAWTAAKLKLWDFERFMKLRRSDRTRFDAWRQKAKAINFGVPGGMGPKALAEYARDAFGDSMEPGQAERFRDQLLNKIYPELGEFLNDSGKTVVTLTGRIRSGVSFTQYHNTQFQGLAADAAKSALVGLIAKNYRVVLFIHDEFVIEVPSQNGSVKRSDVRTIVDLVESETSRILSLPVSCAYVIADRWSKKAIRTPAVGDTFQVWTPAQDS